MLCCFVLSRPPPPPPPGLYLLILVCLFIASKANECFRQLPSRPPLCLSTGNICLFKRFYAACEKLKIDGDAVRFISFGAVHLATNYPSLTGKNFFAVLQVPISEIMGTFK